MLPGQAIDDLALSFVTPLQANDAGTRHGNLERAKLHALNERFLKELPDFRCIWRLTIAPACAAPNTRYDIQEYEVTVAADCQLTCQPAVRPVAVRDTT